MADEEAKQVEVEESTADSIRYLVQIFKEAANKSELEVENKAKAADASHDEPPKEVPPPPPPSAEVKDEPVHETPKSDPPKEPDQPTPVEAKSEVALTAEAPQEPAPAAAEASSSADNHVAEAHVTREIPADQASTPANASDFDAENKALFTRDLPKPEELPASPEDAQVKEEAAPRLTRDLPVHETAPEPPKEHSEVDKKPAEIEPAVTVEAAAVAKEAPPSEQAPSSISYLIKIYKEANNLSEENKEQEKDRLGVVVDEISRNEMSKLNLKPDNLSIKISEVDEANNFKKDVNDSTTYLVQIMKEATSQSQPEEAAVPAIIEAFKIETAAIVSTRDAPKDEAQEAVVVETIEQTTVVTTKELPSEPPILIQEVDKDNVDFKIDEENSVTYLVQIVSDILSKPPRYPYETVTSTPSTHELDSSVNQVTLQPTEEKLQDLTTSQISDGVDSLINELNNQILQQELEHELTSNTLVSSDENYDYNPEAEIALSRPFPNKEPQQASLHEVAHEIVISAVSGAQNKLDDSHGYASPSTNEFNKLNSVEYITRDQPVVFDPPELPTFTKEVSVNITKPTFTKDYYVNLNAPKIDEPHFSLSKDANISLTRPEISVPPFSLSREADVSVTAPSLTKDFSVSLGKPSIQMPSLSLGHDASFSVSGPSIKEPHFATDVPRDWAIHADLPTRDVPKVSGDLGSFKAGEVLIDAGLSAPQFNAKYETEWPVTSESRIDPYDIIRAYSKTSTAQLLRNFNDEIPGSRICQVKGAQGQFGVGFQANPTGPFSITDVKEQARNAGVKEGDLIIAVNNAYVVGISEQELIVQFLEAKQSNELTLELIDPHLCPVDVKSAVSL